MKKSSVTASSPAIADLMSPAPTAGVISAEAHLFCSNGNQRFDPWKAVFNTNV